MQKNCYRIPELTTDMYSIEKYIFDTFNSVKKTKINEKRYLQKEITVTKKCM